MTSPDATPATREGILSSLGPGLALAATGVGAGDLLAALVAGATFGEVLGWAIALGALLKLALNEALARWQLATDTTLLEGWCAHLGRPFQVVLVAYLTVWTFVVAGGLMAACGAAAHAVWPVVGIPVWGAIHSMAAAALVLAGRYAVFEHVMKALVGVMVATLIASVGLVGIDLCAALRGLLLPLLPAGSAATVVGVMGGVGGSVTMLAYGYWIREHGWSGPRMLPTVRRDLAVGYLLTGVFGVAMLLVAATVLLGAVPEGSGALTACGNAIRDGASTRFGPATGALARALFLAGVWAAVATSMLGVWQGVPYLCADLLRNLRGRMGGGIDTRGVAYRAVLAWLAVPPMVLLVIERPMWVVRLYTTTSGLFMPLLAGSLLWLGRRRDLMGGLRLGAASTAALAASLVLFGVLAVRQIADVVFVR